jgi:hypothetical protein
MQRTINVPPERLFADAAAFMTQQGASIDSKTDLSITFSAQEGMSGSDRRLATLIGGSISPGALVCLQPTVSTALAALLSRL